MYSIGFQIDFTVMIEEVPEPLTWRELLPQMRFPHQVQVLDLTFEMQKNNWNFHLKFMVTIWVRPIKN